MSQCSKCVRNCTVMSLKAKAIALRMNSIFSAVIVIPESNNVVRFLLKWSCICNIHMLIDDAMCAHYWWVSFTFSAAASLHHHHHLLDLDAAMASSDLSVIVDRQGPAPVNIQRVTFCQKTRIQQHGKSIAQRCLACCATFLAYSYF